MDPELRKLQYSTTLVLCESTVSNILKTMLKDIPSVEETIKCSTSNCHLNNKPTYPQVYLTYQTTDGKINNLQKFLDDRLKIEQTLYGHCNSKKYCDGVKEIMSNVSEMHLFF